MPAEPDETSVRPAVVRLRQLPAPDALEIELPSDQICVVIDDDTGLPVALYRRLVAWDWPCVLLRLPSATQRGDGVDGRDALPMVTLTGLGDDEIGAALAEVRTTYGSIGAFIYLHPGDCVGAAEEDGDEALVRAAFLMAKHLQPTLTESAAAGWAGFLTVTQLDGELGLDATDDFNPVAGGLAGLTKTLRLEWPEVTCRVVDLHPSLATDDAADLILAELRDPDRSLTEVGYGEKGRVTLEAIAAGAIVQDNFVEDRV